MDPINVNDINKLSDEELRAALSKFEENVGPIISGTRYIFERKLKAHLNSNSEIIEKETASKDCSINKHVNKPELVLQFKEIEAEIYYGVFIPNSTSIQNEDLKKVYTDKLECLGILKKHHGARFKGFHTYHEALCFSEYGPVYGTIPPTPEKQNDAPTTNVNCEKSSPFRGPKSQELVKFRKSIEKGNTDYFEECVANNPRFLVSSGDTPAILQEGSRYNALHIACRNDKPLFCQKVLTTISDPKFFQRLYPDDSYESSERRSAFLLDLYLNMPDKGFNETPLHFACKHGSIGCVKHLLSYSSCDKTLCNKYSQKPQEIICSRVTTTNKDQLSRRIEEVFEDLFYVPVLRDEHNCLAPCIGSPWSPVTEGDGAPSTTSHVAASPTSCSPISPLFKVKGLAGPMSPSKAESFYNRWKKSVVPSPSRNSRGKLAALRLEDHEKGLERVGRDLASEFSVEWAEYWPFLGAFANISSMEGLQKLEERLKLMYREAVERRNREEANDTLTCFKALNESNLNESITYSKDESSLDCLDANRSTLSSIGELCQDLEALRLNASLSPSLDVEKAPKKPIFDRSPHRPPDASSVTPVPQSFPFPLSPDLSLLDDSCNMLNSSTENYNFAVQSTHISAQRVSGTLSETAHAIESHVGPDFLIARRLRNKLKPEVGSLRAVLGRCFCAPLPGDAPRPGDAPDLSFVHLFLCASAVEHLMDNDSTANLLLVLDTLRLLGGHLESFEESSSEDEEDEAEGGEEEQREDLAHFRCVVRGLEKALSLGVVLVRQGREEKIDLGQLGECHCPWGAGATRSRANPRRWHPVNVESLNASRKRKEESGGGGGGRFSRAHSFLHRVLFGGRAKEEEKKKEEVEPVFEGVKKHLSFEKEEEDEDEDDEDTESFASAVSSLEEDSLMATPEEEVKVYVNGDEPSKEDLDVFNAVSELGVDEAIYPYVGRWLKLMESHSKEARKRWTSSSSSQPPDQTSSPSNPLPRKMLFPFSPV